MDKNSQVKCGDAISIAQIQPGEIVLKVGCVNMFGLIKLSGLVEKKGIVIGVDSSREILYRARGLLMAEKMTNVSLLKCEINELPIKNNTIDVIICNGLHNYVCEKNHIFTEFYRVLKDGGRAIISDIIAPRPIPPNTARNQEDSQFYARAVTQEDYFSVVKSCKFIVSEVHEGYSYQKGYLMGNVTYTLSKPK